MLQSCSMSEPASPTSETRPLPAVLLLVLALALGVAVGWLAFLIASQEISPLVLFSLGIGAACGGLTLLAAVWLGITWRWFILIAILLSALAAIVSQHALFYRAEVAAREEAAGRFAPGGDLVDIPSPRTFFLNAPANRKMWWLADAVLTLFASVAVAWYFVRRPICEDCQYWMTSANQGRVAGEPLRHILAQLSDGVPLNAHAARFHLWRCSRCGKRHRLRMRLTSDGKSQCVSLDIPETKQPDVLRLLEPSTSKRLP